MSVYNVSGNAIAVWYTNNGSVLQEAYDVDGNSIGYTPGFYDTAIVTSMPEAILQGVFQGGCTDGEYIYQICFDNTSLVSGNIIKYKISDGTIIKRAFNTVNEPYGHGNDMAYNPNNGLIYVNTMEADGSCIVIDSNDLSYEGIIYLKDGNDNSFNVRQLCYDRINREFYASADAVNLHKYNESFEYTDTIVLPPHPVATHQTMDTDGEFFYRLTYNPNYIDVATIEGRYVKTIILPVNNEPESIMYNWGSKYFYAGVYAYQQNNYFSKIKLYS